MSAHEHAVKRALRMIPTLACEEEFRAYREALPQTQPEVAADVRVQDALRRRQTSLYVERVRRGRR